jgi:hypothetical protein
MPESLSVRADQVNFVHRQSSITRRIQHSCTKRSSKCEVQTAQPINGTTFRAETGKYLGAQLLGK